MSYNRATTGNVEGIKAVIDASDPLRQKNIMLHTSTLKDLKKKSFETGRSESDIIREALEAVL